jgi:hypothetical protein
MKIVEPKRHKIASIWQLLMADQIKIIKSIKHQGSNRLYAEDLPLSISEEEMICKVASFSEDVSLCPDFFFEASIEKKDNILETKIISLQN